MISAIDIDAGGHEALNYIDQIAQALDCVHQQKFFHRDVKSHNIMLRQDRGEAVLIDFGIAKEFVDLETIYLSNSLGTELYKPIEQYEKRGQFGAYTDIYALTVTLYHLLTGAAPGGGSPLYTSKARKDAQDKGWGDKLDEHLWGELAKAGISESTQAAIKAGMEIEPSQRPQNMTAFRKLLGLVKDAVVEIESESYLGENYFEYEKRILDRILDWHKDEETINSCSYALAFDQNYAHSCDDSNNILDESERYKQAIDRYDRILEIQPKDTTVHYLKGNALYEWGRYEEAIISYNHVLECDKNYSDVWYSRGNILCKLGRHEEANLSYDRAFEMEPDYYSCWRIRGSNLEKIGRYEEAVISYDRALEIEPDDYYIWCLRGDALGKLGKYEEAIASYDKIIEIDVNERFLKTNSENIEIEEMQDDYYFIWLIRGDALKELGKYEEAIVSYDRALEFYPDCLEASEKRQIAVEKLERTRVVSY